MTEKKEFKKFVLESVERMGIKILELHLRPMKHNWGSCSPKGRVTFNTELLDQPEDFQREVVIHELLHLKYPNHGKMFQAILKHYLRKPNSA